MCGIVGGVGLPIKTVRAGLAVLAHRGPDASGVEEVAGVTIAHARLSILDLDRRSDQPFKRGAVVLSYNGELWNYRDLRKELRGLGASFFTGGDTEVVAEAISRWGYGALSRMNGMFAIAWATSDGAVHLARDRFGEVPLHYTRRAFASELKALRAMGEAGGVDVGPGEVVEMTAAGCTSRRWYEPPTTPTAVDLDEAAAAVYSHVERGTVERAISDVPVCTLLSGGIDSAAVAYFLARKVRGLVAYTAVMNERSPDLRAAREVAEAIGVELREVRVKAPSADDLARVVRAIEMPYKAQVEIGWACIRLAEVMASDGFKVTFSGEGSDELWGSYGFAYYALKKQGWHAYRKDLFLSQARKNFPRCNKVFMAKSVECRLPFLHTPLVEYALSLPRDAVRDGDGPAGRKAVLQRAFEGRLPNSVVRRSRLGFQEGLGMREAVGRVVSDPKRYYLNEYRKAFGATGAIDGGE